MGGEIRTRWHDWVSIYEQKNLLMDKSDGGLTIHSKHAGIIPRILREAVAGIAALPHYFLAPETLAILESQTCIKSIHALRRANLLRLPHKSCVVEFDDPWQVMHGSTTEGQRDKTRFFVRISERDPEVLMRGEEVHHPFRCEVFSLYQPDYEFGTFKRMLDTVKSGRGIPLWSGPMPRQWSIAPQFSIMFGPVNKAFIQKSDGVLIPEGDMHFGMVAAPWVDGDRIDNVTRYGDEVVQRQGLIALAALRALLMLIRTRGIEREPAEVGRLNKARVRAGKPRVPDHTVVRLGYYFTRSGERVRYDPTKPGHKFQGVHARSGHTKRVWRGCGPDKQAHEIYVESYLVNYTEGDPVPVPRRKVVRASPLLSGFGLGTGAQDVPG